MKKFDLLLLFLLAVLCLLLFGCSKDDDAPQITPPFEEVEQPSAEIVKIYEIKKRRSMPLFGYDMYVMKLSDGKIKHVLRWALGIDLHVGDRIDYKTFSLVPDEISTLNGYEIGIPDESNSQTASSRSLIASDPIETDIVDMFEQGMVYGIPLLPIATLCIETEDGTLITVKKSKDNSGLQIGDRIVYNVYTLFPNEVLALKKLR